MSGHSEAMEIRVKQAASCSKPGIGRRSTRKMILTTQREKESVARHNSTLMFEKQACPSFKLWDVGEVTSVSGPCSTRIADERCQMIFKFLPRSVTFECLLYTECTMQHTPSHALSSNLWQIFFFPSPFYKKKTLRFGELEKKKKPGQVYTATRRQSWDSNPGNVAAQLMLSSFTMHCLYENFMSTEERNILFVTLLENQRGRGLLQYLLCTCLKILDLLA